MAEVPSGAVEVANNVRSGVSVASGGPTSKRRSTCWRNWYRRRYSPLQGHSDSAGSSKELERDVLGLIVRPSTSYATREMPLAQALKTVMAQLWRAIPATNAVSV